MDLEIGDILVCYKKYGGMFKSYQPGECFMYLETIDKHKDLGKALKLLAIKENKIIYTPYFRFTKGKLKTLQEYIDLIY